MATKEIKNFALEGKHGDRGRVVLHLMSGPNNMVYAVLSSLVFADKARKDKPAELAHPFQTTSHRAALAEYVARVKMVQKLVQPTKTIEK